MESIPIISLEEFERLLRLSLSDVDELRLGQSFFSYLHEDYPDIAKRIVGTIYDPFYEDENLYNLFELIVKDF